jgi:aminoglycoside phosphotransferase (APT) family kinase protein
MGATVIHDDQQDVSPELARELLKRQFPSWSDLPLVAVEDGGTDNTMYRLGDELVARFPRRPEFAGQIEKEQQWLPVLASQLPLEIPMPLGIGVGEEVFPWPWSVYKWINGTNATRAALNDLNEAAQQLGEFVRALRKIDATGAPAPGAHNFGRGVPLASRNDAVVASLQQLSESINTDEAATIWQASLAAQPWSAAPQWIHGDLQSGNLLCCDGLLSAVIDFGGLAAGDPACDLAVGWILFDAPARKVYFDTLDVDDVMWQRGRGWALSIAVMQIPYYASTKPHIADAARATIDEIFADR